MKTSLRLQDQISNIIMARILSITNHKGGVGKTTTTASLGVALSRSGERVLLLDLDPQGNLSSLFVHGEINKTVFDVFLQRGVLPIYGVSDNLDIVPSSLDLVGMDRALEAIGGDYNKRLQILRGALQSVREKYDYILIDCPPSLGVLTHNALVASDGVIITLTAESLPTKGLNTLMEVIVRTRQAGLNKGLNIAGILITRYNRRRINRLVEESLRENFGEIVYKTKIRENVDLMESPLYNQDIFSYAPESNGAKDYESLAQEIKSK